MQDLDRTSLHDKVVATGRLDAADVLALRRAYWEDGVIGQPEADFIFDLADRLREPSPEWIDFFLEAMTNYLVDQAAPEGYVGEANAQWLLGRITADGHVKSDTELELLIRIVEKARRVPFRLSTTVLAEVRHAVVDGSGPIRNGTLVPGRITMAEVALLRRVLYAAGGERGTAVSREEAEAMFAIDTAVGDAENVGQWASLFAKAVGNYVMAAVLYEAPEREAALDRHRWLEESAPDASFLDRLVDGITSLGNLLDGLTASLGDKVERAHAENNARDARAIEEAAVVTAEEADWVVDRIGRNGRISAAEAALIDFLRTSHAPLPAAIGTMVDRLGRAA